MSGGAEGVLDGGVGRWVRTSQLCASRILDGWMGWVQREGRRKEHRRKKTFFVFFQSICFCSWKGRFHSRPITRGSRRKKQIQTDRLVFFVQGRVLTPPQHHAMSALCRVPKSCCPLRRGLSLGGTSRLTRTPTGSRPLLSRGKQAYRGEGEEKEGCQNQNCSQNRSWVNSGVLLIYLYLFYIHTYAIIHPAASFFLSCGDGFD